MQGEKIPLNFKSMGPVNFFNGPLKLTCKRNAPWRRSKTLVQHVGIRRLVRKAESNCKEGQLCNFKIKIPSEAIRH